MSTSELKEYIDSVLGDNIRCLLPSYWWKRLFGLVVDKVDEKQDKLINGVNIKTIDGKPILGSGNIEIDIDVDTSMSATSTNPVQNKVIKSYVDNAVSNVEIDVDTSMSATSTNPVQNKVIKSYVDNAISNIEIDIDSSMSATSTNPVQNRVIKSYVDDAVSNVEIDVDTSMSATSTNPVQNKVIKSYVDDAVEDMVIAVDTMETVDDVFISSSMKQVLINGNSITMPILPNIMYVFGTVNYLNISFESPSHQDVVNEYVFQFTCGGTAATISLPNNIKWANGEIPSFDPNLTYYVSILNNLGVVNKFK